MTGATAPVGLGLMCKPPRPGASKTRLAASIGAEAAARLSRAFLEDCAATAAGVAGVLGASPVAYFRPAEAEPEIAAILGADWLLSTADEDDLGATMLVALRDLLRRGHGAAMIMGADVPTIAADAILAAAKALESGDARRVVVVPSADGGYCLIGIRCPNTSAPLFEPMTWSSPWVLRETVERAERSGLDLVLLPPQRDIDEAADLLWLRDRLAGDGTACPATRRALAGLPPLLRD